MSKATGKRSFSTSIPTSGYIFVGSDIINEERYATYMRDLGNIGLAGAFDQWLGIKDLVYVKMSDKEQSSIDIGSGTKPSDKGSGGTKSGGGNMPESESQIPLTNSSGGEGTGTCICCCKKELMILFWLIIIAIAIGLMIYGKQK